MAHGRQARRHAAASGARPRQRPRQPPQRRRASSGIVNVVGEHATYHIKHDAPLTSDIEGIARPVSHWVRTSPSAERRRRRRRGGHAAAMAPPGRRDADPSRRHGMERGPAGAHAAAETRAGPRRRRAVARCAKALRSGEPSMLMLTGQALLERGLALAGRIATAPARACSRRARTRASRAAPAAWPSSGCPTRSTRRWPS